MTVKDASIWISFDDGMSTRVDVKGRIEAWIQTDTGQKSYIPITGRERFMKDAESKIFIEIGCSARRYKDIKELDFAETERVVSDDEIKSTQIL